MTYKGSEKTIRQMEEANGSSWALLRSPEHIELKRQYDAALLIIKGLEEQVEALAHECRCLNLKAAAIRLGTIDDQGVA